MTNTLTRRDFLKLSGTAIGAVEWENSSRHGGPSRPQDRTARCQRRGLHRQHVRDVRLALRRAGQGQGRSRRQAGRQPRPSALQRQAVPARAGRPDEHLRSRPGVDPLIRVGKRGEGKFRKASWTEALDMVAKNMLDIKQQYGPEAMIFSSTHNLSSRSSRTC